MEFQQIFCHNKKLELIQENLSIKGRIYKILLSGSSKDGFFLQNIGYSSIIPFPDSGEELFKIISILSNRYPIIFPVISSPVKNFQQNSSVLRIVDEKKTQILFFNDYRNFGDSMFKNTVRTDIRRAKEKNLILKECSSIEELKAFLEIFNNSKKYNGSTYCLDFNILSQLLQKKDLFKLILVKDKQNQIISGSGFIFFNKNIFYWFNANDYEKREYRGNYLILFYIIEMFKDFDFLNMGYSASKNIEKFKKSWGAKDSSYYIIDWKGK